jgi:hypothetical protein
MLFNFHRVFVVIFAIFAVVAIGGDVLRGEEANAQPEDELIFIPSDVPLDLSEFLRSLDEILSVANIPPLNAHISFKDEERTAEPVQLVGADEPIVIGPASSKTEIEPVKTLLSTQPSNPLRGPIQKTEKSESAASVKEEASAPPMALAVEGEPPALTLPTEEDNSSGIQLGTTKQKSDPLTSNSTANIPSPLVRPKPRMVQIKPITADEQESPHLSNAPREIDVRQAREEDEKAIVAKRPEASTKTFIAKPSTGKLSSPGAPRTLPSDSLSSARALRVESCLSFYLANPESVVERSPWAVMHAMLPFGVEGEIMVGNRRVNSIQWMCYNGTCRTQKLFSPAGRYFRPNIGGGVQGHEGQFLAMLAQSQVSANYPIVVGQNKFTVTDLIRYEMATCKEKEELTFKLIGLSYYIDTEQVWSTDKRNRWNIGRLVQEELAQPINGAACGGTHRLMGLTFAVRQRNAEGRPIDGQFARADRYVKDFVEYAWKLQNPDGSFSTNWFESRGNDSNIERKVQTTGHILEWLAFTVSDEELRSARFAKSVDFLLSQIWDHRQNKWPIGPRGHATRAIALYHQRTTGLAPGQRQSQLAEQIQNLRVVR